MSSQDFNSMKDIVIAIVVADLLLLGIKAFFRRTFQFARQKIGNSENVRKD